MTTTLSLSGRVAGKVALVAGGASGIGRATAHLLAQHGALVCVADRDEQAACQVAQEIGSTAWPQRLDITQESDWQRVLAEVLSRHGQFDVLVNSAGIAGAAPVADQSLEEWRRVLTVNLDGAFLATKQAIRAMRGKTKAGSIVHVGSLSGSKAQPGASAYCVSKAGLLMLARTAALECLNAGDPIRVNVVSPGGVKTPLWQSMPFFQELIQREGSEEAAFRAMVGGSPGVRFAEPEEIALAILYLASDESLYVNGANLPIDQGGNG